jgi:hypothetical protein
MVSAVLLAGDGADHNVEIKIFSWIYVLSVMYV